MGKASFYANETILNRILVDWNKIQTNIWECEECRADPRIELRLRQWTDPPITKPVRLLVVAVAPPFEPGVIEKTKAKSATNDPRDNLRLFVEEALHTSWAELLSRGLLLLHSVKCAIIPDSMGFQNPQRRVVDLCATEHLAKEIEIVRPAVVLALGGAARRAVARSLGDYKPTGLRVTGPLAGTFLTEAAGRKMQIFVTRHIRGAGRVVAAKALCQAAELAGVTSPHPSSGM